MSNSSPSPLALAQALVRGRIRSVRPSRGQRKGYLHVIALPAADQYSSPAFVEVFSGDRLGEVDSDWSGKVQIGGYRRVVRFQQEDEHGGQRTVQFETADVSLTAVS